MFSEDDHRDITFGIVVVAVVVVALIVVARLRDPTPRSSREVSAHISEKIAPRLPETGTVANTSRGPRTIATVYECLAGDVRIVSDRPCGPNAEIREIEAPNLMMSQGTSQLVVSPGRGHAVLPSPRTSNGGSSIPVNATVCDAIQREIDAINARMRQKYTSTEGEHYRERLRELSDARWDANCRWRKN